MYDSSAPGLKTKDELALLALVMKEEYVANTYSDYFIVEIVLIV